MDLGWVGNSGGSEFVVLEEGVICGEDRLESDSNVTSGGGVS